MLVHEVGGHGIARLLDEYIEPGYENLSLPGTRKDYLQTIGKRDWGWGANVDYRKAPDVKWNHMLTDSRYSQEVEVIEGAYQYGRDAYRPTENSIMNQNCPWFNAPSREAIYKAVMVMSEGKEWLSTYDFEDFARFDADNRGATIPFALFDTDEWQESHCPPVWVEGTWKDASGRSITSLLR